MAEPNINYVTKREFLVVSLVLVPLIITGILAAWKVLNSPQHLNSGPATRSTPIVVRGGAMTAFTNVDGGWVEQSGGARTYCIQLDASSVELRNNEDDSVLFSRSSLQPTWTISILGHDPDHTNSNPSKNGLLFTVLKQKNDCNGKPAPENTYVVVSSLGSGNFYPTRLQLPNSGKRKGNIRFLDNSSVGCVGVDADNDEDFCERMAKIIVTDNSGNATPKNCLDGDCSVYIDVQ